jgi:predicted DNA-binding transcriptional regulator AlpA
MAIEAAASASGRSLGQEVQERLHFTFINGIKMHQQRRRSDMNTVYLREKAVLGLLPVSRATMWRWVKQGKFPQPLRVGEGVTVWRRTDVLAFAEGHAQAAKVEDFLRFNPAKLSKSSKKHYPVPSTWRALGGNEPCFDKGEV